MSRTVKDVLDECVADLPEGERDRIGFLVQFGRWEERLNYYIQTEAVPAALANALKAEKA